MKPEVVIDLIRLFNADSIPAVSQNQFELNRFFIKFFLFHTQYHHSYSIDLTKFGFKPDVRDTPFLAYFDFLLKNQSEFDDLMKKGEIYWKEVTQNPKKTLVENWALERLIPDWKSLKVRKDSEWLCKTLTEWSEKWNLTADWCLDFALECLQICKVNLIDEYQIPENYLATNAFGFLREYCNFWQNGSAWKTALWNQMWKNQNNYSTLNKIPHYPEFTYIWTQRNEGVLDRVFKIEKVFYPLSTLKEDFRKRTEEEFWESFFNYYKHKQNLLVGDFETLTGKFKDFHKKLDRYISKVETAIKPFVTKTVAKKSGDKHFRWLIEYQIPPIKSYNKLSIKYDVDRRAVMDGIKNVSELLCLTLHPPSKGGREKNVKDLIPRQERRSSNN
jgi:hypothetical protein